LALSCRSRCCCQCAKVRRTLLCCISSASRLDAVTARRRACYGALQIRFVLISLVDVLHGGPHAWSRMPLARHAARLIIRQIARRIAHYIRSSTAFPTVRAPYCSSDCLSHISSARRWLCRRHDCRIAPPIGWMTSGIILLVQWLAFGFLEPPKGRPFTR